MSKNSGALPRPEAQAGSIEFTLTMPLDWLRRSVQANRNNPLSHIFLTATLAIHGRLEEARAAALDGVDYLIFGPVFETPSKMRFGAPLGIDRLREVCAEIRIPVLAIGGISLANAGRCFEAGVAGIAAIRLFQDVGSAAELRERVEALRV